MKESYSEGVANHTGLESCVGLPRGGGEALTEVRAGWVLNREIVITSEGADRRSGVWKETLGRSTIARAVRTPRGRGPHARTETPRTGIGRSHERPGVPKQSWTSGTTQEQEPTPDKHKGPGAPALRLPTRARTLPGVLNGTENRQSPRCSEGVMRNVRTASNHARAQMEPGPRCEPTRRRQR